MQVLSWTLAACVLCATDLLPYGRAGVDLERAAVRRTVIAFEKQQAAGRTACDAVPKTAATVHVLDSRIAGDRAIVLMRVVRGATAGHRYLVLERRGDSRWQVVPGSARAVTLPL